jgi:signal transduction histidine kinase
MAAGVAHEINNPLAAILLYTSNMYKKAPEDGPFKEGLSVILRETKRCKGIIQGLLEFSRAKEPNKTMVNVNAIIERSIGILGNELRLRHIEIVKQLSATVPDSMLDENQMEQVFVNLLLNAAQALIEKGTITISSHVDPQERDLIIQVADTGPGIPTENLGKIFDPFFSTKESGTGLGLAVSYGIVKSHRGDVVVENLPDKGCRFTLRLPLLSEETQTDV